MAVTALRERVDALKARLGTARAGRPVPAMTDGRRVRRGTDLPELISQLASEGSIAVRWVTVVDWVVVPVGQRMLTKHRPEAATA